MLGYLKPGGELTQSEKGRAGRFASLKSVTLFSLRTFPLVAIIGSRKFRTREGRILHILYGRGKKERARQPLTTSFLVIEKILTNREESWVHGGRGGAFLGLHSSGSVVFRVFRHLTTLHRQLSAFELPLSDITLPGKTLSSAPRKVVQLQDLTLYSIESVQS